ncbi:MAG: hypothetical protein K2M68_06910, partial [Muribaculaceae bacterium]|nr:hypothetical protein [Muribaculaceae bacterium]
KDGVDGKDGKDGQNGADGKDGVDGKDGKDGITPEFKIENGDWYVSTDNGQTWQYLGRATGADGKDGQDGKDGINGTDGKDGQNGADGKDGQNGVDGDSMFSSIDTSDPDFVIFTLADGTQIKLPTWYAFEALKQACQQMNANIQSLQTIVDALQSGDYIVSYSPLVENGKQVGYTITFAKGGSIIIYNGKDGANGSDGKDGQNGQNGADGKDGVDGKDGYTPSISVKQDTDGIYYWTVDGEWLKDDKGNKVPVTGRDGTVTIQPNSTRTIAYTVSGNTENLTLEVLSSGCVKAKISDKNSASGQLTVTTGPTVDEYDKVVLLATNGHVTTMTSISFEEAGLRIDSDLTYDLTADSQTIDINIETNASYTVSIPEEAQDWISHTMPSRTWRSETITLKIEANESDARTATVSLLDEDGKPLGSIVINQNTNALDPAIMFPDEVFRKYVLDNFDTNIDGRISTEEALKVTEIYVGIVESIEGVQYFPNLKILRCFGDKLSSIDVSQNTKLTNLECNGCLSTLDISKNTLLTYLDCSRNKLTELNVTKNKQLVNLLCYRNQLTELNLYNNKELSTLACQENNLTQLHFNNNSKLTIVNCCDNNITDLMVESKTKLETLLCSNNKLTELNLFIDGELTRLECDNNNLTELDFRHYTPKLTEVRCNNNRLTTLNISNCTQLSEFQCANNNLAELDVTNNAQLTKLFCENNSLTSIDLTNNRALEYLHCNNNYLTTLDVSKTNIGYEYDYFKHVLECYMPSLKTLILKTDSDIDGITNNIDYDCISETTEIQYVD